MIGESISTPCPPPPKRVSRVIDPVSGIPELPSFGHPWHVKIRVHDGIAHVNACNGMTYIMSGLGFGTSWPVGRWTKSERSVRHFANRCQHYCDRENSKLAKDTQNMIPLAAAIRTLRKINKDDTSL